MPPDDCITVCPPWVTFHLLRLLIKTSFLDKWCINTVQDAGTGLGVFPVDCFHNLGSWTVKQAVFCTQLLEDVLQWLIQAPFMMMSWKGMNCKILLLLLKKSCSEDHVRCSQEPSGSVTETVFLVSFAYFRVLVGNFRALVLMNPVVQCVWFGVETVTSKTCTIFDVIISRFASSNNHQRRWCGYFRFWWWWWKWV